MPFTAVLPHIGPCMMIYIWCNGPSPGVVIEFLCYEGNYCVSPSHGISLQNTFSISNIDKLSSYYSMNALFFEKEASIINMFVSR